MALLMIRLLKKPEFCVALHSSSLRSSKLRLIPQDLRALPILYIGELFSLPSNQVLK
jgi:hypothetical protein